MTEPAIAMLREHLSVRRKLRLLGEIVFETAWHVGSGSEGHTGSDLGVLLDATGRPLLPGSSLKGKLRSTCERLAECLRMTACMLDCEAVNASGLSHATVRCASDIEHYKQLKQEREAAMSGPLQQRMQWIADNTCDVCKLFGSPLAASRIRVSDGILLSETDHVQVRDSVVLDRDSHTAVPGLKYDYEVVSAGSRFRTTVEVDNPSDRELALLGAACIDWSAGVSLGGLTSRGLGRANLQITKLARCDLSDGAQLVDYLTRRNVEDRYVVEDDWEKYFVEKITNRLDQLSDRGEGA